jgi:hypothetical protein
VPACGDCFALLAMTLESPAMARSRAIHGAEEKVQAFIRGLIVDNVKHLFDCVV